MTTINLSFGYYKGSKNPDLHYNVAKMMHEISTIEGDKDKLEYIRVTCFTHGVCRSYETNDKIIGRVVLYANRNFRPMKGKRHTDFYYECNGIVICAKQWVIISYPVRKYSTEVPNSIIDRSLSEDAYDIINVYDGTIVNIYPYGNNQWGISSSRAYEMSTNKWMGSKNYATILFELFTKYYPKFVETYELSANRDIDEIVSLNFGRLPRDRCYTIGFRSHEFHPVRGDPERIWFVQSAGLPIFPVVDTVTPYMEHIPKQDPCTDFKYKTVKDIRASFDADCESNVYNYGYLLRRKDGQHSVFIESPLMAKLRTLVYSHLDPKYSYTINNTNRYTFNIVSAYLNNSFREDFIKLFPDAAPVYESLKELTTNVVKKVLSYLCINDGAKFSDVQQLIAHIDNVYPNDTDKVTMCSKQILVNLFAEKLISPLHGNSENILRDIIISPYYSILFTTAL